MTSPAGRAEAKRKQWRVNNAEAARSLRAFVRHQQSQLHGSAARPVETMQIGAPVEAGRAA
jgi:hypothetical protein